jgi:predicted metal-dependent phosphoesterase TrpH
MIDLHTHTDASDGILSLEELVHKAEEAGLKAIAITDHDTVQNARRLKDIESSVELIPGIELSVYDNKLGYIDLHVLGLFINPEEPRLLSTLERLEADREEQKKAIVERLNELGYGITYEETKAKAGGAVGRPHIARALMDRYPEEFRSIGEAFEKLLDQGKPAFLSRTAFFGLEDCIKLIHEAGGVAILGHPGFYRYDLKQLLHDFKRLGGDGIETIYDYAANSVFRGFREEDGRRVGMELHKLAEEMGFLESGGSDFHGPNKGARLGALEVPDSCLDGLKEVALLMRGR